MSARRAELPALSQLQREIMEIVWNRGEISAIDVRQELSAKRELAKNTVRTLLERMKAKGWLKSREVGRTYFYSAAQPREASVGQKVHELLDNFCGGSPVALVSALLNSRGLQPDELKRIRKMLDEARAIKSRKGDR
jgi:BlaI family transcriptional regulator, penicillinase repressor